MNTTSLELYLADLYAQYVRGGMSYAEYVYRYDRACGRLTSFAAFRVNGGSRAEYDRMQYCYPH